MTDPVTVPEAVAGLSHKVNFLACFSSRFSARRDRVVATCAPLLMGDAGCLMCRRDFAYGQEQDIEYEKGAKLRLPFAYL
ncbi:hypothetical protein [Nonomuraea roseola]|uniref:Uncharacterized protein n=1 Tax=Nonomuraea roseola TaxID=46179 RepID=A0ABV5PSC9_9ACTN